MADKMKEQFEKTTKLFQVQNAPRSLISDGVFQSEFVANGNRYKVMRAEECFNIGRQTAYSNIKIPFDLCNTPTGIKQVANELKQILIRLPRSSDADKDKLHELLYKTVFNFDDSFKGEYTSKYAPALYLCTLFVIRENEDMSTWTWELADEKINDWNLENLNVYDFFRLALSSSQESVEILKQSYQTT